MPIKRSQTLYTKMPSQLVNQNELESKMKKIEMEKRQYNSFHFLEKRKLITRFAQQIMLTNSSGLNKKLENFHKIHPIENEPNDKENNLSTNKNLLNNETEIIQVPLSRSCSFNSIKNQTPTNQRQVSFDGSKSFKDLSEEFDKSLESPSILRKSLTKSNEQGHENDLNDNKTKNENQNNIILPKLAIVKRSKSNLSKKVQFVDLLSEQKKLNEKSTKSFIDSLSGENSGFCNSTDSKGRPLCLGFDNYGILLKSSSTSEIKPSYDRQNETNFKNPFEYSTPLPYSSKKKASSSIETTTKTVKFSDFQDQSKSQNKSRINSAGSFKQKVLRKRKEEEEKICSDTFKAQNIRSLTFKQIVV